jgi:hypothetical protein
MPKFQFAAYHVAEPFAECIGTVMVRGNAVRQNFLQARSPVRNSPEKKVKHSQELKSEIVERRRSAHCH